MKGSRFHPGRWLFVVLCLLLVGAVPMDTMRTSRAVFSPEREIAPTIQITGTRVNVQHRVSGSGKIKGTALRGRRTYEFKVGGSYTVEPGIYKHIVYGQVPSGGALESIVKYQ